MMPIRLVAAALAGLALTPGAQAFDCGRARSRIDRAICADPAAKAADDAMNDTFAALRSRLDAAQKAALLANQRRWLKSRDSMCTSEKGTNPAACLRDQDAMRTRALSGRPEAGPGTPDTLLPVFFERVGNRMFFDVSIVSYRFEPAKGPAEARLNGWSEALLGEAPSRADDNTGSAPYSFERTARITYASDRLLSLTVTGYEFTGGAHGQSTSTAFNLDMTGGRELKIDDLAAAKDVATLQSACRDSVLRELKARFRDSGEDPDKDGDAKSNFDTFATGAVDAVNATVGDLANWSFGGHAATVTFVADTIGPHAFGEFTCEIPYSRLRSIAKPSFPLPPA